MGKRLDHKLDCKDCGTIYLDIPPDVDDSTLISCSTCGKPLGTWGDLQHDFNVQSHGTRGVFDLSDGQIEAKRMHPIKPRSE